MALKNARLEHNICIHEREFGEVTTLLEKISKEVYGNGEVGLSKSIPRMEEKINNLAISVSSHSVVVTKLLEYQASHNGEAKGKKDAEIRQYVADELKLQTARDKRAWVRAWVMAVIAFITVASGIYFGFHKMNKDIKTGVKTEIEKIK